MRNVSAKASFAATLVHVRADTESYCGDGEEKSRPHCRAGRRISICWAIPMNLGFLYLPLHPLCAFSRKTGRAFRILG